MSGWARLRRILAMTCEEAAELSSRRLDEPLAWTDRLAWRGHLLVCGSCRHFRRQLALLRDAARRMAAVRQDAAEPGLSDDAKARITRSIRDAASQ